MPGCLWGHHHAALQPLHVRNSSSELKQHTPHGDPCLRTQVLLLLIHLRKYRKEIHLQPLPKPSAFLFHLSQTIPLLNPTKTKSQEESSNISRKLSPWGPYLKPFCSPNSKTEIMLLVDLQGCNQLNVFKCFVAMRNKTL